MPASISWPRTSPPWAPRSLYGNAVDLVVRGAREGRARAGGRAGAALARRARHDRTDFRFRGNSAANTLRNFHDHGAGRGVIAAIRTKQAHGPRIMGRAAGRRARAWAPVPGSGAQAAVPPRQPGRNGARARREGGKRLSKRHCPTRWISTMSCAPLARVSRRPRGAAQASKAIPRTRCSGRRHRVA